MRRRAGIIGDESPQRISAICRIHDDRLCVYHPPRSGPAPRRPPFDRVMMFKILGIRTQRRFGAQRNAIRVRNGNASRPTKAPTGFGRISLQKRARRIPMRVGRCNFGKARPSLRPLQRFALHRIQTASFDGTAERSQVVQTVGIFDFRQPQGIQVFRITLYL